MHILYHQDPSKLLSTMAEPARDFCGSKPLRKESPQDFILALAQSILAREEMAAFRQVKIVP
jgi:hypothetical protein